MTTKTITVTEDAYRAMKALKRADESFSELFQRIAGRRATLGELRGVLKQSKKEQEEFHRRVKQQRTLLGEGLKRRAEDVRARFKRAH